MKKLIVYFIFTSPAIFGQDIPALLPDSAGYWKKSGQPEIYIENELFRLIDGGADIFIEYGFNRVITQRYENSNENFIDVEIYEMKDSSSAFGIFSLFTLDTGDKINFNCEAYAGDEYLLFWKGNFYVGLTGINLRGNTREELLQLAQYIEARITPARKPSIINLFENADKFKITYIKGNLGFYNISRIYFGKNLRIYDGLHFTNGEAGVYIFNYNNNEESRDNFVKSVEDLNSGSDYTLLQNKPDFYIYKVNDDFLIYWLINNHILLLVSKNKLELEKISEEIEEVLLRQG